MSRVENALFSYKSKWIVVADEYIRGLFEWCPHKTSGLTQDLRNIFEKTIIKL
jgi:hypothetical protein